MTRPARITPTEMEKAAFAVAKAGLSCARIIMRLELGEIEIIIGEPDAPPAPDGASPKDEDYG